MVSYEGGGWLSYEGGGSLSYIGGSTMNPPGGKLRRLSRVDALSEDIGSTVADVGPR